MRDEQRAPEAMAATVSRPGHVRDRRVDVHQRGRSGRAVRPLGDGFLDSAHGRPGRSERRGTSDSGDAIEQHRTVAIAVSSAAVCAAGAYWVLRYYEVFGPR
jgi:hypothetical protein